MVQIVTNESRPDLGGNLRHGDRQTHCPVLWRYLVDRFAVRSVLDVGCGEGHAVRFFSRLGCHAHGIDGLIDNVRNAVIAIAQHDLCAGPFVMPVDLVWSCEVAEHIPAQFADHYADTLANGTVVAMTHALPGQVGHAHVNCQPMEYWVEKMTARGFVLDDDYLDYRRIAATDLTFNYYMANGLLFHRR